MDKKLSEEVQQLFQSTESKDSLQIERFIEAEKKYENLIQEGLASKRGYNILTTAEIYNPRTNSQYKQR